MLHLIPLVTYVSMSTATVPPAHMTAAPIAPATASVVEVLPKLRLPFFGGKKDKGTRKASPMDLVDRRLRDLVSQQESWFAKEGRYGRNAYRAGLLRHGDSTAFEEVQVEILYAGKIGWTALASHPSAPGKSCVVYVGFRERLPILPRTHQSARDALLEGIPACDDR